MENGVLRTLKMSFDSVYDWNCDMAVIHDRDFLNVSTTSVPGVQFKRVCKPTISTYNDPMDGIGVGFRTRRTIRGQ